MPTPTDTNFGHEYNRKSNVLGALLNNYILYYFLFFPSSGSAKNLLKHLLASEFLYEKGSRLNLW